MLALAMVTGGWGHGASSGIEALGERCRHEAGTAYVGQPTRPNSVVLRSALVPSSASEGGSEDHGDESYQSYAHILGGEVVEGTNS
jgi:hypothetical protein